MRTSILVLAAMLLASAASAAPAKLTIHNPLAHARTAARIQIPPALVPKDMKGQWVAAAAGQVAPLQRMAYGMLTALDLPAKPEIALVLRPRKASDPKFRGVARAVIPTKVGSTYKDLPKIVVPPTHVIHDPLFPIEGAGWESDRIGYRVYLDKRNANDIYGKKKPAPILDKIGHPGQISYHDDAPWGMDVWKVGDSLGAGGVGVLRGKMATQLGDMKKMTASVVANGPVMAEMRVDCEGWLYDGKPMSLTENFAITAGSRLSTNFASATPGVKLVAGFGKYPNTVFLHSDKGAWGYMASWGRQSEDGKDVVGAALFYPIAEIARTGDDGRSYYVLFKNPAKAIYAFAGVWPRGGGDIRDEAAFRAYVERTALEIDHPVSVTAAR